MSSQQLAVKWGLETKKSDPGVCFTKWEHVAVKKFEEYYFVGLHFSLKFLLGN